MLPGLRSVFRLSRYETPSASRRDSGDPQRWLCGSACPCVSENRKESNAQLVGMKRLDLHRYVVARFAPHYENVLIVVVATRHTPGRPANGYDRTRSPQTRQPTRHPRG